LPRGEEMRTTAPRHGWVPQEGPPDGTWWVKGNVPRLKPTLVVSFEELDQATYVLSECLEGAEKKV